MKFLLILKEQLNKPFFLINKALRCNEKTSDVREIELN